MNPDERELRRALDERSAAPSPDFRARVAESFKAGRPRDGAMPAIATVVAVALVVATVGVLTYVQAHRPVASSGPPSAARTQSPPPIYGPTTAQVSAPSLGVVWALVGDTALYRSLNQGVTWDRRPLPNDAVPSPSMSFVDANEGWLMAGGPAATQCSFGGARIWHTTDAGATWHLILTVTNETHLSAGIRFEQCKEGITFIDSRHGFVEAWDDNSAPTVYRTSDGGLTWAATRLPDPSGFVTAAGGDALRAEPVRALGSTLLLVAYGMQRDGIHTYVFRSDDLGMTWRPIVKVPSQYVAFVSDERWLLLVAPGQSQETTNAGRQWHPYPSDFNTDTPVGGPQILFATSNLGYAEGRGLLQRTTDGGLHWTRIFTPAQPLYG